MSSLLQMVLLIAIGLVLGFLGRLLPADFRTEICNGVLTPLYDTFLNVFGMCGVPLIFLSVVLGILGVGDIHTFSLIGKKMIGRYGLLTLIAVPFSIVVSILVFNPTFGGSGFELQYGDFVSMVLGWFPTNLLNPFISSNAMQLIILGAGIGIAIILLDGQSGHIAGFAGDLNSLLLKLSSWLAAILPYFIALIIMKTIWLQEGLAFISVLKPWITTTVLQVACFALMVVILSLKCKVSIKTLCRKTFRVFLVALASNSCGASVPENYTCCAAKLGLDSKVFTFGIPIGTSIFKPATAIRLAVMCLFAVTSLGINITVGWVVMLFILAITFSIAIPAIPGGTILFCSMIFSQLGISADILPLIMATDVFFDCISTAFNQVSVPLALTYFADDMDLIDRDALRA